jgi:hypothetical protein
MKYNYLIFLLFFSLNSLNNVEKNKPIKNSVLITSATAIFSIGILFFVATDNAFNAFSEVGTQTIEKLCHYKFSLAGNIFFSAFIQVLTNNKKLFLPKLIHIESLLNSQINNESLKDNNNIEFFVTTINYAINYCNKESETTKLEKIKRCLPPFIKSSLSILLTSIVFVTLKNHYPTLPQFENELLKEYFSIDTFDVIKNIIYASINYGKNFKKIGSTALYEILPKPSYKIINPWVQHSFEITTFERMIDIMLRLYTYYHFYTINYFYNLSQK